MSNYDTNQIKLLHCDSLEYMQMMENNSIDLICTDPPYELSGLSGGGTVNNKGHLRESLKGLTENTDITEGYDIEVFGHEFIRILKSINIYLWCNKKQIPRYFAFYVNKHKCKFDIICWHKTNAPPTYSNKYLSDTEYCLHFFKGKGKTFPPNYESAKTYYIAPMNVNDKKLWRHPTIKPLEITKRFISNSSRKNELVFDPFMGSGTTAVACNDLHRRFIGCEIDKNYFEIAKERIKTESKI